MLLQDTTPVGSKDYTDSCITFNTTSVIFGSTHNVKKICSIFILTLLSPNSDQHKFSPNKIHRLLRAKSMRINKMITKILNQNSLN